MHVVQHSTKVRSRHGAPLPEKESVQLSIAHDPTTLHAFRHLVFEEYAKRGWINPDDYPDGVMTDEFDTTSDALVIQSSEGVIAGTRIVRDDGHGFPHSDELQLESLHPEWFKDPRAVTLLSNTPREHVAEVTRVVGKKKRRMLTWDIIKCLYWYSRVARINIYVMVIDLEFFTLCDTLGIPISPIGVPVHCEGSWTIPAITEPGRYPEEIQKKSPRGWEYIAAPDNLDASWALQ
jgi:hypothetical protein